MMIKRLPVIPTLIMLIAVGIMVRLGFWQLDRLHQKEALLVRYADAQANAAEIEFPAFFEGTRSKTGETQFPQMKTDAAQAVLYRRSRVNCIAVENIITKAGASASGESGVVHIADCALANGRIAKVVLGWSRSLNTPGWTGGEIAGVLTSGGLTARLVADPPIAGLAATHRPDPASIPNNHLSYAVQWFAFALTALVIFGLALRKRLAAPGTGR